MYRKFWTFPYGICIFPTGNAFQAKIVKKWISNAEVFDINSELLAIWNLGLVNIDTVFFRFHLKSDLLNCSENLIYLGKIE